MKVSLIQIDSCEDKEINFKKAQEYILEAVAQRPDIICLPENFLYRGDDKTKEIESLDSGHVIAFQELAKTNKVNLILGSVALVTKTKKTTNSSLVINRNGKIVYIYSKIHMYDVERQDFTYKESDTTQPGTEIGFFELDGIKIGIGICIDLRYPEYFRELTRLGAEIVFLPSNFRKVTGELAWEVLTKARAIENQIYFCACCETGGTGAKERCGHTRIVSFDGKILSEIAKEEGVISSDLDFNALRRFREEFPVLKHIKDNRYQQH